MMTVILLIFVSLYAAIVLRFLTAEQFEPPGMSEKQRRFFACARRAADVFILIDVVWFLVKLSMFALGGVL